MGRYSDTGIFLNPCGPITGNSPLLESAVSAQGTSHNLHFTRVNEFLKNKTAKCNFFLGEINTSTLSFSGIF